VYFQAWRHTGGVASKYDLYWTEKLAEIRAAVARAASGLPSTVRLPGLTGLGDRQSWHGVTEVRGDDATRSSMAHATSLGKTVAANGVCTPWPQSTFRFAIATSGDTLTISTAEGSKVRRQTSLTATRQEPAPPRNTTAPEPRAAAPAVGQAHAAAEDRHMPDAVVVERFYLALGRLAEILYGPRLLRQARGTDGWTRHGVYFFTNQVKSAPMDVIASSAWAPMR
jgi:hypothetical protein